MEIELTQGKKALIDDEDWPKVKDYRWCAYRGKSGIWYAHARHRGSEVETKIQLHRLVLDAPAGIMVDHVSKDGLDCRKENLRLCTNPQNQQNSGSRGGTSRYKGVAWYKRYGKWRVAFNWMGKAYHVGYFMDEEEAAKEYDRKIAELAGPFARLNFPTNQPGTQFRTGGTESSRRCTKPS